MIKNPTTITVSAKPHSGQVHITAMLVEVLREKGLTGSVQRDLEKDTLTITVNGISEESIESIRTEQVKHRMTHICAHEVTEF